ncbi:MAG: beta-N-acetylhexosaminidase [Pseudomonadota bacterium]
MSARRAPPRSVIFGLEGCEIAPDERDFFAACDPLGFILFARNVRAPAQLGALVSDLRALIGRGEAPILIDQEGGRVQRLRPPHWRAAPAAGKIGALAASNVEAAAEAARLNGRLIAGELAALGIGIDCAPVADLGLPGAHDIIGERAYGPDPHLVARLAREAALGLLDGGVLPVVKHIPGHGRARVDSHIALPVVDAPLELLDRSDFVPFRALADLPWAMTAHVLFRAIDPERPATTSRKLIAETIRGRIGFDGVLISDDLSMPALSGRLAERAQSALAAGCDLVLHCNGALEEMRELAAVVPPLGSEAERRIVRADGMRRGVVPGHSRATMAARLDALLAEAVRG